MKVEQKMSRLFIRLLILAAAVTPFFVSISNAVTQDFNTLSTGISIDSRTPHPEYSLLLKFAEKPRGMLLADINVAIYRNNEKIFEALSEEPWFFIDLPDGKYTVKATNSKGVEQNAGFSISGKKQKVIVISWDTKDVDLGAE